LSFANAVSRTCKRSAFSYQLSDQGGGRNGDAEFTRFCSIAMGSATELEYHPLLAKDRSSSSRRIMRKSRSAPRVEADADGAASKADR
jgi:four helix bundle protein